MVVCKHGTHAASPITWFLRWLEWVRVLHPQHPYFSCVAANSHSQTYLHLAHSHLRWPKNHSLFLRLHSCIAAAAAAAAGDDFMPSNDCDLASGPSYVAACLCRSRWLLQSEAHVILFWCLLIGCSACYTDTPCDPGHIWQLVFYLFVGI